MEQPTIFPTHVYTDLYLPTATGGVKHSENKPPTYSY